MKDLTKTYKVIKVLEKLKKKGVISMAEEIKKVEAKDRLINVALNVNLSVDDIKELADKGLELVKKYNEVKDK
ncbi:MAG: hypothetical protein M0R51_15275 [Clostridia bacterium]|jgi:hypothetical protein|nr:hypothetical protein [Clostridia bacterium]